MADIYDPLRQPFGAGGPDIVLPHHFDHRGAGHSRHQGRERDGIGKGRQRQAAKERKDAVRDGHEADRWKEVNLDREGPDKEEPQPENRDGEAQHREEHDSSVHEGAHLPRRQHSDGHAYRDREGNGQESQAQGRLEARLHEAGDRVLGEDGGAQVAL